jgi:hypothetical protein
MSNHSLVLMTIEPFCSFAIFSIGLGVAILLRGSSRWAAPRLKAGIEKIHLSVHKKVVVLNRTRGPGDNQMTTFSVATVGVAASGLGPAAPASAANMSKQRRPLGS